MNLRDLRAANIARDAIWDPEGKLDLDFFLNELGGELGEALNVLKKLHREQLGLRGSRTTVEDLIDELSDCAIVIDLACYKAKIDLQAEIPFLTDFAGNSLSEIGRSLYVEASMFINEPDVSSADSLFEFLGSLSQYFNRNFMEAISKKFNLTSTKYNLPIFIGTPT